MYLLIGWKDDKVETWLYYVLFSQVVGEYTRMKSAYNYTKVSLYKIDLRSLTIELLGEE